MRIKGPDIFDISKLLSTKTLAKTLIKTLMEHQNTPIQSQVATKVIKHMSEYKADKSLGGIRMCVVGWKMMTPI